MGDKRVFNLQEAITEICGFLTAEEGNQITITNAITSKGGFRIVEDEQLPKDCCYAVRYDDSGNIIEVSILTIHKDILSSFIDKEMEQRGVKTE